MYSKATIMNLALGALLLQRQITNPDTEQSNEGKILNTWWDIAYRTTLEDLDLDSTSSQMQLSLVAKFDPNAVPRISQWCFAYKYPSNCAFFRRIQSCQIIDNKESHIPKRIGIYNGQKVIFTDHCNAIAEFVPYDLPIGTLSANVGLAIAFRLAMLSAALVTGKGAKGLIGDIEKKYVMAKAEAQAQDERENFSFSTDATISEFVQERLR